MRNPSSQSDFAAFFNAVVPIPSLMARSACTLALDKPKMVFDEVQNANVLHTLVSN